MRSALSVWRAELDEPLAARNCSSEEIGIEQQRSNALSRDVKGMRAGDLHSRLLQMMPRAVYLRAGRFRQQRAMGVGKANEALCQASVAERRRICHTSRQSWLAHWKNE